MKFLIKPATEVYIIYLWEKRTTQKMVKNKEDEEPIFNAAVSHPQSLYLGIFIWFNYYILSYNHTGETDVEAPQPDWELSYYTNLWQQGFVMHHYQSSLPPGFTLLFKSRMQVLHFGKTNTQKGTHRNLKNTQKWKTEEKKRERKFYIVINDLNFNW